MGISDPSFLGFIRSKVQSWISDLSWVSCGDYWMSNMELLGDRTVCQDCHSWVVGGHHCRSCGRIFCSECIRSSIQGGFWKSPEEEDVFHGESCRFCSQTTFSVDGGTVQSFEKWEQTISDDKSLNMEGNDLLDHQMAGPLHLQCSIQSSYECDEDDYCEKNLPSPSSIVSHDISQLESNRSSPLSSPTRLGLQMSNISLSPQKLSISDQEAVIYPRKSMSETGEQRGLAGDYVENSGPFCKEARDVDNLEMENLIWMPPPPKDAADDIEVGLFRYDDDDDDGGYTGHVTRSCSFDDCYSTCKNATYDDQKEVRKDVLLEHLRALVSELLQKEGICDGSMDPQSTWLGIVSSLAWQAANFVKPDTSREGSMDPGDYVKVKCLLTGSPSDSLIVKGIVCTRNVRHKRMITQHKNPRILIIGGELEFQKAHKLASLNTLITGQKPEQLDLAFSKIEIHKPNVLLVEKSASPDAVEYMLSKGISLVTNVKRTLLQRIAKCTSARITESFDDLPSTRLGSCESFYISRVSEDPLTCTNINRKPSKTLMFFDRCPGRLGCTILLKGKNLEELKKVKRVVQFAIFAAYHLSLEISFFSDEGASPYKMQLNNRFGNVEFPTIGGDLDSSVLAVESLSAECDQENGANESLHSSYCTPTNTDPPCSNFEDSLQNSPWISQPETIKEDYQFSKIHPMESPVKDFKTNVNPAKVAGNTVSNQFSSTEKNQSIPVSLSTSCKGMICGRSRLLRIKFYGNFDKPLGRYLQEDLFNQASFCASCREPMDAHVVCYTHQLGSLTINVKCLTNTRLPGEHDGRIWMWHRCLKCASKDGLPPASRRVVMSHAACDLSFGKFLQLSFSSRITANRLASCGHSLQRDCLRFYGFGNKVALFRYAPVDILSVHLPPPVLDFSCQLQQKWLQQMAINLSRTLETLHDKVHELLNGMEQKVCISEFESIRPILLCHISNLRVLLGSKNSSYIASLQQATGEISEANNNILDVLKINLFRRSLLVDFYMWDHRFFCLDFFMTKKSSAPNSSSFYGNRFSEEWSASFPDGILDLSACVNERNTINDDHADMIAPGDGVLESRLSSSENISDKIDLAWTGSTDIDTRKTSRNSDVSLYLPDSLSMASPQRVQSFDSTMRTQERFRRFSSDSRQILSFNTLQDADSGLRDAIQNLSKAFPTCSGQTQNLKRIFRNSLSYISSASCMVTDGARLLLPLADNSDVFTAVYDDEPSSIISYALCSNEHAEFVASDKLPGCKDSSKGKDDMLGCHQTYIQSLESNEVSLGFAKSDEFLPSLRNGMGDPKQSHFRFAFDDELSFPSNKVKFSVTCYFAKQFFALRRKCCPSEVNFIRSLSRCKKWSAEGGKSNAYFARSFDERFIIKQVTRTEMDSFEEFAPQYFSYLTESINSGSPTCLAKILGIFQVTTKNMKGGREVRTDLMVMENLFYGREISCVYDLKGSRRSRYISNTSGGTKVLLDSNLIEALQTKPIFLGSKAKRILERAVWNDTAFLASIDVMDYSLLVGIDDGKKELVIGIIDFMRQYTWDKHLETWVKASGILGGPKDATPTIISPGQYKKRFRTAMSSYFLTVPDEWPS